MLNRIKYLVEELQRHDQETYLERHVKVTPAGGRIRVEPDTAPVGDEVGDLEARVDELTDCIQAINYNLKGLKADAIREDYRNTFEIIRGLIIDSEAT
jgi:hypothetical protein